MTNIFTGDGESYPLRGSNFLPKPATELPTEELLCCLHYFDWYRQHGAADNLEYLEQIKEAQVETLRELFTRGELRLIRLESGEPWHEMTAAAKQKLGRFGERMASHRR